MLIDDGDRTIAEKEEEIKSLREVIEKSHNAPIETLADEYIVTKMRALEERVAVMEALSPKSNFANSNDISKISSVPGTNGPPLPSPPSTLVGSVQRMSLAGPQFSAGKMSVGGWQASPDPQRGSQIQLPQLRIGFSMPMQSANTMQAPIMHPSASGVRKAVIVGCNYDHLSCKLRGTDNDAIAVAHALLGSGRFEQNNIRVLRDNDRPRDNWPVYYPTTNNILTSLDWLVDGAGPGDSLFFYFSGYGSQYSRPRNYGVYESFLLPCDFADQLPKGFMADPEWSMKPERHYNYSDSEAGYK